MSIIKYECDEEGQKIFKNILKHLTNGFYRIIILWELNKEPIHGYGLMKKIDQFYEKQIEEGVVKKTNPSKLYPILQKMEEKKLIEGYWEIKDNKNIKYYKITQEGIKFLNILNNNLNEISSNTIWTEFITEMILTKSDFTQNKEE